MNATLWDIGCVLTNCTNVTDCYLSCSNMTATLESTEIIADYHKFVTNARFVVQRVCMPVIYALGIIGNIMSIIVLTQRRMRSSTNNYLTALATFDMLYLLFHFSLSLQHYPGYKHIIAPWYPIGVLLTDTSSNTSVWLTVSFTVERYIAVCHPMVGKRMCTRSRANIVIIAVFAICFAITLPVFFEWAVVTVQDPKTNISYYEVHHQDIAENPIITMFLYWYSAIIFIIIPLCALSVFNSFLIYSVHKSRSQRREMTMCAARSAKDPSSQESKITIMLIGVVVVFMLCQLPAAIHLIYTSTFADHSDRAQMNILRGLGNIFNMMTAVNASVNFILYCCLSEKFRQTFIRTMCPWYRRVESPEHSVSNTAYTQMRDPDSCIAKKGDLSDSRTRSLSKSPRLQVRDLREDGRRRESQASSSSHGEKSKNGEPQENHIDVQDKETLSLNTTPTRRVSKGSYLTFDEKTPTNNLNEARKDTPVRACIRKDNKSKIHFVLPETTLKLLRRNKRDKRRKKSGQTPPLKTENSSEIEIAEKVTTL